MGQPMSPGPPNPPGPPGPGGPPGGQPPYQQPYGPPPGQPYGQPVGLPNAPGAVGALVCGLIGLVVCPIVGIAGIVMGNKAKREINNSSGAYGGQGMATAGQILGWIAVAYLALIIIGVIIGLATGAFTTTVNNGY